MACAVFIWRIFTAVGVAYMTYSLWAEQTPEAYLLAKITATLAMVVLFLERIIQILGGEIEVIFPADHPAKEGR